MKTPVIKRLLPFALALCLTCGSSFSAYAAEAKDAEAQISEESTASEKTQESTGTKSTEETAVQNTAASGKTGTTGGPTDPGCEPGISSQRKIRPSQYHDPAGHSQGFHQGLLAL